MGFSVVVLESDPRLAQSMAGGLSSHFKSVHLTRSEEELRVGTQQREAGRARLRKYVVTEQVTQTVPVRHEEVRVEREPISDANRDQAE